MDWIDINRQIPEEDKMCLCFCPDEPIDCFKVASWDNQYGFVDNEDYAFAASYWLYIQIDQELINN